MFGCPVDYYIVYDCRDVKIAFDLDLKWNKIE